MKLSGGMEQCKAVVTDVTGSSRHTFGSHFEYTTFIFAVFHQNFKIV